jgi:hypothetical protein
MVTSSRTALMTFAVRATAATTAMRASPPLASSSLMRDMRNTS